MIHFVADNKELDATVACPFVQDGIEHHRQIVIIVQPAGHIIFLHNQTEVSGLAIKQRFPARVQCRLYPARILPYLPGDIPHRAGQAIRYSLNLRLRQPFPGPGLGVRIVGEVTPEKVRIVQDADAIYREELAKAGCDKGLGQFFAALTNMRSVGVMGDERTYDYAVALRAVITSDFMTAEAAEIPFDVLFKVMTRVINEVKGVNRVLYDLTSKPPGTIELE